MPDFKRVEDLTDREILESIYTVLTRGAESVRGKAFGFAVLPRQGSKGLEWTCRACDSVLTDPNFLHPCSGRAK